jgi:hypothetical protein
MHINDNYQIHHDKHHLLLTERITKLEKERLHIEPRNLAPEIANELAHEVESEYIQEFDNQGSTVPQVSTVSSNSSNNLIDATKKMIFG